MAIIPQRRKKYKSLTHRLLFGWENQFSHLWQDSMIPKSSMDGITLFHYILIERCEAFIVAVLGPLARTCVGNNAARGAPTHPPAMLHLLQKLTW